LLLGNLIVNHYNKGLLDSQQQAHGQWFSPGTPASSTTKTGRHDIAEVLLKVALNTKNQIKIINNHGDKTKSLAAASRVTLCCN
jgi:hypothetical protein